MPNDRPALVHGATESAATTAETAVHQHIGHLMRTLHEALRELGIDSALHGTRERLPDTRDRLDYIARVTGEAAERVLDGVDRARAMQEQISTRATDLHSRWRALDARAGTSPETLELIEATCECLVAVGSQSDATRAILTDIMVAQGFHDLTGQVVHKVVSLAQDMEHQLMPLLLGAATSEQRQRLEAAHTSGNRRLAAPISRHRDGDNIAATQADVDQLLGSLGF